jgi:drug/metabolite transporter (DMT)-like permease/glutaredoxin
MRGGDGAVWPAVVVASAVLLLFSTGGAAIKATDLSGIQVACLRSGIAALALPAMIPGARKGWSRRTWAVGVAFAVTLILFVQANKLTTAANSIFLQSTAPFYLLLLGPVLLREPIRRRDLTFMGVVAAGMALVFVSVEEPRATATSPALGNGMALLSGVGWALTVAGLRWLARSSEANGAAAAAAAVAGNAIAFAACLPAVALDPGVPAGDWPVIVYLGVIQIGSRTSSWSGPSGRRCPGGVARARRGAVPEPGVGLGGPRRGARRAGAGQRGAHPGRNPHPHAPRGPAAANGPGRGAPAGAGRRRGSRFGLVITLLQLERCPWCAAVRQALANVDAQYQAIEVPRDRAERHLVVALSGQPLVPVIVDGETVVWDSRRIVRYLYETYGGSGRARSASELPDDVGGIRRLTPPSD